MANAAERFHPLKQTILSSVLGVVFLLNTSAAFAERSETTIKAPGFQLKQNNGWFNRGGAEYKDAMGNSFRQERGWFGTRTSKGSILGNSVEERKGLFGKRTTVIDASNLLSLPNIFNIAP